MNATKQSSLTDNISIVYYDSGYQKYFEQFNRYWIEKYFVMEPLDEYVLTNPEEALLKPGGAILMALWNGEAAGTVALRKFGETVYEFTKLAVDNAFQRNGIAEALSYAGLEKAAALGATEVILFTNSSLKPAIALYEKIGFKHIDIGKGEYKRSDVKMTININQNNK